MNASALTYNLEYTYNSVKSHQLDQVWDPTNGILTKFTYNTTGSVTKIDDPSQAVVQDFFWNEQQQLTGVSNQQGVHHYVYDHSGERVMKSSLINSTVYLNDQVIDSASNLDPYTVYVNPYYVVTSFQGGDRVSKHYYMNQQRVATDISINYDPSSKGGSQQEQLSAKGTSSSETAWSPALTDFNEVLVGLGQKSLDTASLKLPTLASYYPEAAKTPATSSSAEGNPSAPRILFWYHPDYLGNVDLITERDGYTHEFFMYNPWGEEMHQWNANTYAFTSPYRFNAKELDPETGLAYYGARYYQNKLGVWLSVDRLAEKYPGLTPYNFVANNPILFVDPDGNRINVADMDLTTRNRMMTDLSEITGLKLTVGRNGYLEYSLNVGASSYSGKAQALLIRGIDNENEDNMATTFSGGSKAHDNFEPGLAWINLDSRQIESFINGSVGVNKKTLGYGMVFLHELAHTESTYDLLDNVDSSNQKGETC